MNHQKRNSFLILIVIAVMLLASFPLSVYADTITYTDTMDSGYTANQWLLNLPYGGATSKASLSPRFHTGACTSKDYLQSSTYYSASYAYYMNATALNNDLVCWNITGFNQIVQPSFYMRIPYINPAAGAVTFADVAIVNHSGGIINTLGMVYIYTTNPAIHTYKLNFNGHLTGKMYTPYFYRLNITRTDATHVNVSAYNGTSHVYVSGGVVNLTGTYPVDSNLSINFNPAYAVMPVDCTMIVDNLMVPQQIGGGLTGAAGCRQFFSFTSSSSHLSEVPDNYMPAGSELSITPMSYEVEALYYSGLGSMTLAGASIYVYNSQALHDSSLSDYYLKINGISFGNPACFNAVDSATYEMLWNLTGYAYTTTKPYLLIEIFCLNGWQALPITYAASAGWAFTKHSTSIIAANGIFDGDQTYYGAQPGYYFIYVWAQQLTVISTTSGFKDLVTTDYATYNQYDYQTPPVMIHYTIDSKAAGGSVNYVKIYHNSSWVTDTMQSIPYTIPLGKWAGDVRYTPYGTGTYTICLNRLNTNVSKCYITVNAAPTAGRYWNLWVSPIETKQGQYYNIGYRLFDPSSYTGQIYVYDEGSDTSVVGNAKWHSQVLVTPSQGNFSILKTHTYNDLIILYTIPVPGSYFPEAQAIEFYDNGKVTDKIVCNEPVWQIKDWTVLPLYENISGSQHHPGSHVTIRVSGKDIFDASNSLDFATNYDLTRDMLGGNPSRYFNVTLEMTTTNGTVVLANSSFTVYDLSLTPITGNGGLGDTVALIPDWMLLPIAIGIIIGLMLAPLGLVIGATKYAKSEIKIPAMPIAIASIVCGLVGFFLDILWGLLPWWSFFGFVLVLAIVILIMLYGPKKEEG